MTAAAATQPNAAPGTHRTDAVTDLALTMPLFVAYHVGVVFLSIRNAADLVTSRLAAFAEHDRMLYVLLTLGLGLVVAALLLMTGHRDKLRWQTFAVVAIEGVVYAMLMRFAASWVAARLSLGPGIADAGPFAGAVMSIGAGFYEELTFRAVLFGLGSKFLLMIDDFPRWLIYPTWALVCSLAFSGWHHVGAMGEPFTWSAFVFRTVCGLLFTLVFALRGFAPAVWTHAIYDLWVIVF